MEPREARAAVFRYLQQALVDVQLLDDATIEELNQHCREINDQVMECADDYRDKSFLLQMLETLLGRTSTCEDLLTLDERCYEKYSWSIGLRRFAEGVAALAVARADTTDVYEIDDEELIAAKRIALQIVESSRELIPATEGERNCAAADRLVEAAKHMQREAVTTGGANYGKERGFH